MRVLLATDGSPTAQSAVDFVAGFPFPDGSEVRIVTVIRDVLREQEVAILTPEQRSEYETARSIEQADHEKAFSRDSATLRGAGWSIDTEIRRGDPADEIIRASDEHDVDVIVLGSHGMTGFRRFLLGSVSNQVLQSASRSVLIVRKPEEECKGGMAQPPAVTDHPWRFLIGYDGSPPSDQAIDFCTNLALDDRATVKLLTVLPMVHLFRQDIRQEMNWIWQKKKESEKASLEAASDRMQQGPARVTTELAEATDVSDAILAAADEFAADLIILGHKGKGSIERFLMGSVTPRIAHHSCRSVLAIR